MLHQIKYVYDKNRKQKIKKKTLFVSWVRKYKQFLHKIAKLLTLYIVLITAKKLVMKGPT